MNEDIKKVLERQEADIMRLQQKQDLKMAQLSTKQAREQLELLDKAFHSEMKEALKNGLTEEAADSIAMLQKDIKQGVQYYNDCLELADSLKREMGSVSMNLRDALGKSKDSMLEGLGNLSNKYRDFGGEARQYVNDAVDIVRSNLKEKRNMGLSAMHSIAGSVKEFNRSVLAHGASKLYDMSRYVVENCRTHGRAYLRNCLESDARHMGRLNSLHEKLQNMAERGNSLGNRFRNVGRALRGEEFAHVTPKEHGLVNALMEKGFQMLQRSSDRHQKEYEKSLGKSASSYEKSKSLREAAGIQEETYRRIEKAPYGVCDTMDDPNKRKSALDQMIERAKETHREIAGELPLAGREASRDEGDIAV